MAAGHRLDDSAVLGNCPATIILLAAIALDVTEILLMGRATRRQTRTLGGFGWRSASWSITARSSLKLERPFPESARRMRAFEGRREVGIPDRTCRPLCICIVFVPVFLWKAPPDTCSRVVGVRIVSCGRLVLSFTMVPVLFNY